MEEIELPVIIENKKTVVDDSDGLEEKRETLIVIATLGQGKQYFGKDLSCVKIYKMKKEIIEKYFSIYQRIHAIQTTKIIMNQGLNLVINGFDYLVPLKDKEILIQKLKENELLTRELENIIGYTILKSGRFCGLFSGLIQIATHIKRDKILLKVVDNKNKSIDNKNESIDNKNKYVDRSVENC